MARRGTDAVLLEEHALPQDPSDLPVGGASSAGLQSVSDPADGMNDMDTMPLDAKAQDVEK